MAAERHMRLALEAVTTGTVAHVLLTGALTTLDGPTQPGVYGDDPIYLNMVESMRMLEAAGMGRPGKPNTLVAQVKEVCQELANVQTERDRHAAGAEGYRTELDAVKAVVGLAAGGTGLPLAEVVRQRIAARSRVTITNEMVEAAAKALDKYWPDAWSEYEQAEIRRNHRAQLAAAFKTIGMEVES
jgi:hypothetical protein